MQLRRATFITIGVCGVRSTAAVRIGIDEEWQNIDNYEYRLLRFRCFLLSKQNNTSLSIGVEPRLIFPSYVNVEKFMG